MKIVEHEEIRTLSTADFLDAKLVTQKTNPACWHCGGLPYLLDQLKADTTAGIHPIFGIV